VDSLYRTELVTESDGSARLDEHGVQVTRRMARFPLKWTMRHFDESTDSYLTKDETLSEDERVGLDKLKKFVDSFKQTCYVTKAGAQALDSKGRPCVEKRFVNT
ncbi:hypothetical protein A2U01_0069940, partial [Trifolium medium]|nr:hypothetical protein [Trifolium medium]